MKALDLDMAVSAQAYHWEEQLLEEMVRQFDETDGLGNALSTIIHLLKRR